MTWTEHIVIWKPHKCWNYDYKKYNTKILTSPKNYVETAYRFYWSSKNIQIPAKNENQLTICLLSSQMRLMKGYSF